MVYHGLIVDGPHQGKQFAHTAKRARFAVLPSTWDLQAATDPEAPFTVGDIVYTFDEKLSVWHSLPVQPGHG